MENLFEGLDIPSEVQETLSGRIKTEIEQIKEGVRNDAEFINSLKSQEAGKLYGSMERVFNRNFADIDLEKYSELSGVKKMEAILKDGLNALADSKDTTSKEWQEKYLNSQAELKRLQEEEIPSILEKERGNFYQRFISDEILKDSLEFETVCANDARVPLVNAYLVKNNYQKKWNDKTGTYEIVTADGVKVTKDDKVLDNKAIIKEAFEFNGVLKKSNGNPGEPAADPTNSRGVSGKLKLSANALAMKEGMAIDN